MTNTPQSKAPPSVHITPVRSKPTFQISKVNSLSLSITKLGAKPTKFWFVGCEYKCLFGECNQILYDETDLLKHARAFHELSVKNLKDLANIVESNVRSFICEVCHAR